MSRHRAHAGTAATPDGLTPAALAWEGSELPSETALQYQGGQAAGPGSKPSHAGTVQRNQLPAKLGLLRRELSGIRRARCHPYAMKPIIENLTLH